MKSTAILLLGALFLASCSDDDGPASPNVSDVELNLSFKVDNEPLVFDTIRYTNEAGNHYSVNRLEFYLSRFRFWHQGHKTVVDTVFYVNARNPAMLACVLPDIPVGMYDSVTFVIGVDSVNNVFGNLPATTDNINMEWPESMGGGYHHMKLEGYYESGGNTPGYAMHLGRNGIQVSARYHTSLEVAADGGNAMNAVMNINEWYKNPSTYDFDTDGNHSMGNMPAMMKLSMNGVDVFYQ